MKLINRIWQFVAHIAYVITKIDELIEQVKVFRSWLFDDEPEKNKKNKM